MDAPRRRINLLPPEYLERAKSRQAWVVSIAIIVAVVLILGVITVLRQMQAKNIAEQAKKLETTNLQLEQKARELEYLEQLQRDFDAQKQMVQSAWTGEVSWVKVLQELASVMPDTVYLRTFNGQADPQQATRAPLQTAQQQPGGRQPSPRGGAAPGKPTALTDKMPLGTITFNGTALTHRDVGNWLYRINRGTPSLSLAWVSNSTATIDDETGLTEFVTFQSNAYLTPYALGWMGRCAMRGFDSLTSATQGECGHSYYGPSGPAAPGQPGGQRR